MDGSPDYSVSASTSTIRTLHASPELVTPPLSSDECGPGSSYSSPRSNALPSPPDSPSSDSVSSFPSVSSSFFFSSAAASPPHHPPSDHARDSTQGLIIPSLTLPSALRRPTPYGQTLGDLRLLLMGRRGSGKSALASVLLEDNGDVVDIGTWEDLDYGKVLRASTDWIEHRDAHGLEKFEPSRNLEMIELPGYDHDDDVRIVCCPESAHSYSLLALSILGPSPYTIHHANDPDSIPYNLRGPRPQSSTICRCSQPSFKPNFTAVYCSRFPSSIR